MEVGKLERAFWEFHNKNPEVYQLLVFFAKEWGDYHRRCSIQLLYERVRWQMNVQVKATDVFKLNNNHTAFYSRLIEEREEGMKGFFRMRRMRIQPSFGPDNNGLPSGDHVS